MRHIYVEIGYLIPSEEALVLGSIRRLLLDLPKVNVGLYSLDNPDLAPWVQLAAENQQRIKLFPETSLKLRWPDAWEGWSST